jgi:hypothetical protein
VTTQCVLSHGFSLTERLCLMMVPQGVLRLYLVNKTRKLLLCTGLLTIEKGVPNLTGLFSLQNVTPIHVAPAVWLGLHWKGLRGEAVAAGMITGGCMGCVCMLAVSPAWSVFLGEMCAGTSRSSLLCGCACGPSRSVHPDIAGC